jgi:ribosomal protein L24E
MMRIGILEAKNPIHGLADKCKMFNTGDNQVTVFTTRKIADQVKNELNVEEYKWVIKGEDQSAYSFLKETEKICNEGIDLLFVNTAARITPFLFFNPKCKKVLRVHNSNWWFKWAQSYRKYYQYAVAEGKPQYSGIMEYLDPAVNAAAGPLARKAILRRYDAIVVEYQPIQKHIIDSFHYMKNIYVLPNLVYEGQTPSTDNNKIRFVVPGVIAKTRRDYFTVLSTFEELLSSYHGRIELYLLGIPFGEYGCQVIDQCRGLKEAGCPVFYYEGTEYIPETEFRAVNSASDIIIAPLYLDFYEKGVHERYSQTKATGVMSDAIRYAKPLFVPDGFEVSEEMKTSVLTFTNADDLKRKLEVLITRPDELERLQKAALVNSEKFALEKMRAYCSRMFAEVMNN